MSQIMSQYQLNSPNIGKTDKSQKDKSDIQLMKDEYKPRDLKYDKIKNLYIRELKGPSLKEMEANKRVLLAQKQIKSSEEDQFGESVH